MALTTTIAGADSDSYITVEDAADYFEKTSRAADWAALSEDQQTAALFDAMRFIDAHSFIGSRATEAQALQWPRVGGPRRRYFTMLAGYGVVDLRGKFWSAGAIPTPIQYAQCEMALALTSQNFLSTDGARRVKQFSADGLAVTYDYAQPVGSIPNSVKALLNGFVIWGRLLKA